MLRALTARQGVNKAAVVRLLLGRELEGLTGSATEAAVPCLFRRCFAAEATPKAPAKAGGGGKPGGKKKAVLKVPIKQPNSGKKDAYGAKHRPDRAELREAERKARIAAAAKAAAAASKSAAGGAAAAQDGGIYTDDEEMQVLYDLLNKDKLDFGGRAVDDSAAANEASGMKRSLDLPAASREELWQRAAYMESPQYERLINVPADLKGRVAVVEDDFDYEAQTDLDLSDRELDTWLGAVEPEELALRSKRGYAPSSPLVMRARDRAAGISAAEAEAAETVALQQRAAARKLAGAAAELLGQGEHGEDGGPAIGVGSSGSDSDFSGSSSGGEGRAADAALTPQQLKAKQLNESLSALLGPSDDEGARAKGLPTLRRRGGGAGAAEGSDDGALTLGLPLPDPLREVVTLRPRSYNLLSDGEPVPLAPSPDALKDADLRVKRGKLQAEPLLPRRRDAITRAPAVQRAERAAARVAGYLSPGGGSSAEEEGEAMLDEQTRSLFDRAGVSPLAGGAGGAGKAEASGLVSLSGDDDSDWGGDPNDMRFLVDRDTQLRDYRTRLGLRDTDDEARILVDAGRLASEHVRIAPAFGDDINRVPRSILEELASPYEFVQPREGQPYPDAVTVREAAMTPAERVLDEQRKKLRDLIERPLPIVNRPVQSFYAMVAAVDMVTQVVSGGMIQSTRCCLVVGNGRGGIGFGIGKDKEPFMATKQALSNAQRDMIHVSTHKGSLYHDLIGKRNNLYVIIRTMPSSSHFNNAPPFIQDVFEMAGISHASAKIIGSRRRNPYNVVQALFDAFNHHHSPEHEAAKRGLRMQWQSADRFAPRNVYPFSPSGPRYPAANGRLHGMGTAR